MIRIYYNINIINYVKLVSILKICGRGGEMAEFQSRFQEYKKRVPIDEKNCSVRFDVTKCKNCALCRRACETMQTVLDYYSLESTGDMPVCVHCGQCANACPFGAITEVNDVERVKAAIADKDTVVTFQTAPAVRVGLGEAFGLEAGTFVQGKMIAALRKLGADYVFDTNYGADLTIQEEASELLHRVVSEDIPLPQFTSCCPAWVEFAETFYPELIPHLSTAKSPISIMSAAEKIWFAEEQKIAPEKIVNVCVTPCTAKKAEIRRPELNAAARYWDKSSLMDTDICITTRELADWIKEAAIDFDSLEDERYDPVFGEASGGGIIFGNTGGVMEAALRSAYYFHTGSPALAEFIPFEPIRGLQGIKEADVPLGDVTLRIAAISGLGNARAFIDKIRSEGTFGKYAFIEVMACPGGCIGGGGQPKVKMPMVQKTQQARVDSLYKRDDEVKLKASWENPEIQVLYNEFFEKPLSEKSEAYLHTIFTDRSADLGPEKHVTPQTNSMSPKYKPVE